MDNLLENPFVDGIPEGVRVYILNDCDDMFEQWKRDHELQSRLLSPPHGASLFSSAMRHSGRRDSDHTSSLQASDVPTLPPAQAVVLGNTSDSPDLPNTMISTFETSLPVPTGFIRPSNASAHHISGADAMGRPHTAIGNGNHGSTSSMSPGAKAIRFNVPGAGGHSSHPQVLTTDDDVHADAGGGLSRPRTASRFSQVTRAAARASLVGTTSALRSASAGHAVAGKLSYKTLMKMYADVLPARSASVPAYLTSKLTWWQCVVTVVSQEAAAAKQIGDEPEQE